MSDLRRKIYLNMESEDRPVRVKGIKLYHGDNLMEECCMVSDFLEFGKNTLDVGILDDPKRHE